MDNVTFNSGTPLDGHGHRKLKELWNAEVSPETIGHTLGRPEAEVRAKAAELKLPQHVAARAG